LACFCALRIPLNQLQHQQWVNEVLREVLTALMHAKELRDVLIFKGARILNLHLQDDRESMDIDASAAPEWAAIHPNLEDQAKVLKTRIESAVRRYFEGRSPVRFTLEDVKIARKPQKGHPRGWDAFFAKLTVRDNSLSNVRGLPPAEIDIAAPELLGPEAVEMSEFLGDFARVYSLHRIAGEKLRAYLTSLPEYRRKMGGGEREFRMKDLYDIGRILKARPTTDLEFWLKAAGEFRLACQSRYVDCQGPETFKQDWELAQARYEADMSLRRLTFSEVAESLERVLNLFVNLGAFPLRYPTSPLPSLSRSS
jgi:hypothetical protein